MDYSHETNLKNFRHAVDSSESTFIIGVAGDSGSGKTTFTRAIRSIFGNNMVTTISLDDYHVLDRDERKRTGITPLSPEANNFSLLEEHVALLKEGKSIDKPVYNHDSGKIEGPVRLSPSRIIIIEGLHPLFTEKLRELIDFSIYVSPDTDVKYYWKIKRDVNLRGYREEEVLAELESRRADYENYVHPQIRFANAVIGISKSRYADIMNERGVYRVVLYQKKQDRTIRNINLNFDLFAINSLAERGFSFDFSIIEKYEKKWEL
ncbi:phosphoribulokinase [Methanolacinia petrolearia]|uniref:phosphoribulokinase n=1 Tax=Methanolacinia petrolearia TaxID=54120 RepID=UPI003BA89F73